MISAAPYHKMGQEERGIGEWFTQGGSKTEREEHETKGIKNATEEKKRNQHHTVIKNYEGYPRNERCHQQRKCLAGDQDTYIHRRQSLTTEQTHRGKCEERRKVEKKKKVKSGDGEATHANECKKGKYAKPEAKTARHNRTRVNQSQTSTEPEER